MKHQAGNEYFFISQKKKKKKKKIIIIINITTPITFHDNLVFKKHHIVLFGIRNGFFIVGLLINFKSTEQ